MKENLNQPSPLGRPSPPGIFNAPRLRVQAMESQMISYDSDSDSDSERTRSAQPKTTTHIDARYSIQKKLVRAARSTAAATLIRTLLLDKTEVKFNEQPQTKVNKIQNCKWA